METIKKPAGLKRAIKEIAISDVEMDSKEVEACYECSATIDDLLLVYKDEPVKRLFMCINHGVNIVCFHCFHTAKHKTLFKCQCSTIEHWISMFPCCQSTSCQVQQTQPNKQLSE